MNLLQRIKEELSYLPPKDKKLCEQFLKDREFNNILDIVSSCIVMKTRDNMKESHSAKWETINLDNLEKLRLDVEEYMDYGRFPEDIDEYNYY